MAGAEPSPITAKERRARLVSQLRSYLEADMMGKKKLSPIRAEVREVLAASGQDEAWFDEQIRKLEEGRGKTRAKSKRSCS